MLGAHAEHQVALAGVLVDFRHRDIDAVQPHLRIAATDPAAKRQQVHRRRTDEVRNEHRRRPVVDLARRAELLDHALVHDGDRVGHGHGFELVVRHVDGGGAETVVQRAQLAAHQFAELRIEGAQRLVHQEAHRLAHDGAAERDALPIAAGRPDTGRSSRWLIRRILAASSTRRRSPSRAMPCERNGKAMFCAHVHVRIEREQLEHEGDVALRRRA